MRYTVSRFEHPVLYQGKTEEYALHGEDRGAHYLLEKGGLEDVIRSIPDDLLERNLDAILALQPGEELELR